MSLVMAPDAPQKVTSIPPNTANPAPTPSRKRRRRAPTTGAADDCFACQEAHTNCDRRRPYCTQCIDRGKTCSGYKTQLTWGMGVASRGKLRGLSLPVAKSKKAVASEKQGTKQEDNPAPPSAPASTSKQIKVETQGIPPAPQVPPFSAHSIVSPATFDFVNSNPNGSLQSPITQPSVSQPEWTPQPPNPTSVSDALASHHRKAPRRHSLQPLQMSTIMSPVDYGQVPMTANVLGGCGDSRYENAVVESPATTPYNRTYPSYPAEKPYISKMPSSGVYVESYNSGQSTNSWQIGSMSSGLASDQSGRGFQDNSFFSSAPTSSSNLDNVIGEQHFMGMPGLPFLDPFPIKGEIVDYEDDVENVNRTDEYVDEGQSHLSLQLSMPSLAVGKTYGLRNLITYYDQVIAPVIVAFDGPTNPYRTHILRLASESEALQHAIAALSASNLRMRRDHEVFVADTSRQKYIDNDNETSHAISVRKSSIAHGMLIERIERPETSVASGGKHSRRELYHKGESIKALNARLSQLRDHTVANDDTVLATLLVLCLYHVCDTGVAKFRTQFAGVKKLMALRSRRSSSRETKWLITMFKWFDAMTATVNDREGQFEDDADEFEDYGYSDWALENLAGCDGRLFKIISKLGRLNILSQGKAVNGGSSTPKPKPPRPIFQDFYGVEPQRFDGNGWMSQAPDSTYAQGESCQQFQAEWFAIRQELLDWQFDPATIPPSMFEGTPGQAGTDAHILDLNHISESFRYSALIYTERLAHPTYPSGAPNFQGLVENAIHHMQAVKSDVYLLWPLFITGTECVHAEQRDLIRKRCRDISSDSGFYNNMSSLTLLERIWAEKDEAKSGTNTQDVDAAASGPFSWRRAMASEDDEYIVI